MNNLDHITNPVDLVFIAIRDAAAAKADKRYKFDVDTWHGKDDYETGPCLVCMGGAIIAGELGCDINDPAGPARYNRQTCAKLVLIDQIRKYRYASEYKVSQCGFKRFSEWSNCMKGIFDEVSRYRMKHGDLRTWKRYYNLLMIAGIKAGIYEPVEYSLKSVPADENAILGGLE